MLLKEIKLNPLQKRVMDSISYSKMNDKDVDELFSEIKKGIFTRLSESDFNKFESYKNFSMGQDGNANTVSGKNTVWEMTQVGPMLRAANDIAISYRKYAWNSSPYLYKMLVNSSFV